MIENPYFWVCAVLAVMVTGISKGGFGGIAVLAVPLMSLTISPIQAAGIMLPTMLVMDVFSIWAWRKSFDKSYIFLILPGALVGIAIGFMFSGKVDEDFVRIAVGLVAVSFSIYAILGTLGKRKLKALSKPWGVFASLITGFTSFIAHSGGPPYQAYMIPQGLDKKVFVGTGVIIFFVLNAVKVPPYMMLGQFSLSNITTSIILMPLAPIGVWIGVWLNGKVPQDKFYQILYGLVLVVGVKLLIDGFTG